MSSTQSTLSAQAESSVGIPFMSLPFTCNTCKALLESNQLQRAHMHTRYHRYNLKRKIASLPPLSVGEYEGGVSKPVKATAKQSPVDAPELSNVNEGFGSSNCLFCNVESPTLKENLQHMEKRHGMFIPYQDILKNAKGLLNYLFTIITEYHECLYCNKIKDTTSGIRSHMTDKGHCMIALDEALEQFYDVVGAEAEDQTDKDKSNDQDRKHDEASEKPHDFYPDSDHELYLPSGRTLGHRSQSRYYRQHMHPYPTPTERATRRSITVSTVDEAPPLQPPAGRHLATRSRDETGIIGVDEFKKRALRVVERKALQREARVRNQFEAKVNKETNHQKHFKPDVPGRSNG